MAGIYIHVPFCRKACHYCNFHFSTSLKYKDELVGALLKEIAMVTSGKNGSSPYLAGDNIQTIYFGGGTPSLLNDEDLEKIFLQLKNSFTIEPEAEITFEANPDDISIQKLNEWRHLGINRLSIGVQSFVDEHLTWMNRAHSANQSLSAIASSKLAGFNNISIDLIYGVPGMSNAQWIANLEQAKSLEVTHLSSYALTVEPATALARMIKQKKASNTDDKVQSEQFSMLTDWAEQNGFEQYEISNLSKPGMRSRHNSSYWQGKKYLGLGPSAHSFDGTSRQWNVANNALYIQSINENKLPVEIEYLTPTQQYNEYVMTSLRTIEGTNVDYIEKRFGINAAEHIRNQARSYIIDGKLQFDANVYRLTREGKFFADGIAADLFK